MRSEACHTQPTDWCPHPERWYADDAQATEQEVSTLIGALVIATQPEFVLETGSYFGQTTRAIGLALQGNGHGRAESLEYRPERAAIARDNCANLPVRIVERRSDEYVPPQPVGFAFLDSEQEERAGEVARYWEWFENGAIVAVHDTSPHHVETSGLDLYCMTKGMPYLNLRTPRGLLLFQVAK